MRKEVHSGLTKACEPWIGAGVVRGDGSGGYISRTYYKTQFREEPKSEKGKGEGCQSAPSRRGQSIRKVDRSMGCTQSSPPPLAEEPLPDRESVRLERSRSLGRGKLLLGMPEKPAATGITTSVLSLSAAFDRFDTDKSAGLSMDELQPALEHLGISANSEQAANILKTYTFPPLLCRHLAPWSWPPPWPRAEAAVLSSRPLPPWLASAAAALASAFAALPPLAQWKATDPSVPRASNRTPHTA